jgi:Uma2 family endonuclease
MTLATPAQLMTTEEFLSLPDDGVDRELVRGELREKGMIRRNFPHSRTESNIAKLLGNWLDRQPTPRGIVASGEVGFRLRRNPDTVVGVDVAYISAQAAAATPARARIVEGPPVLAVEILSPSDQQRDIIEKIEDYLESGVKIIWIVEPIFRTVTIYRPDEPPILVNDTQQLTAEPHLPGFATAVSAVFDG